MKMQIQISDVSTVVSQCTPSTGNLETDVQRVVNSLALLGINPYTRKDVTAILMVMGVYPTANATQAQWDNLGKALKAAGKPVEGKRGHYEAKQTTGLTMAPQESGVTLPTTPKVVKKVLPPIGESLTSKFFEAQIRDNALDRKVCALLRRKFQQENPEDLLAEVRMWFMVWASQGTCDDFIRPVAEGGRGKPPTLAILTIWVEGKIVHRLYREGQDALARHTKGVRTQGEVTKKNELGVSDYMARDAVRTDTDAPRAIWVGEKDEDGGLKRDFIASTLEEMAPELDENELSLVRDVVRVRRRRAADRYARMFDHLIEGRSKEETALLEGCSELRVTHLYQRVRDDLREAPLLLETALKVLQAIANEPFTTHAELETEIPPTSELGLAIELLVLRGLVTEERGNSLLPTDAGRAAVESDSLV